MKTSDTDMPRHTLVSVVIPVYNGEDHIRECIESVYAQNYSALEVIVVDDGSEDNTAATVSGISPTVKYIRQENAGSSAARNRGIDAASGEFLAFLDADDLWVANKLALQLQAFFEQPELDVVWGEVQEFSDGQDPTLATTPGSSAKHPGTALFRTEAFHRTGGFTESYKFSEVVDWVSRIADADLNELMLPEVLMYRRLHETNKGRINENAHEEYLLAIKRHLDRKRS